MHSKSTISANRDLPATDWTAKWIGFDHPVRLALQQTDEDIGDRIIAAATLIDNMVRIAHNW